MAVWSQHMLGLHILKCVYQMYFLILIQEVLPFCWLKPCVWGHETGTYAVGIKGGCCFTQLSCEGCSVNFKVYQSFQSCGLTSYHRDLTSAMISLVSVHISAQIKHSIQTIKLNEPKGKPCHENYQGHELCTRWRGESLTVQYCTLMYCPAPCTKELFLLMF